MRRRWIIWTALALTLIVGVYVVVFSYWWLRSPSRVEAQQGKQVRIVEFQFNALSWHTEPLWIPAFWFMESVCGYEQGGYAAMEGQSVQLYVKTAR